MAAPFTFAKLNLNKPLGVWEIVLWLVLSVIMHSKNTSYQLSGMAVER